MMKQLRLLLMPALVLAYATCSATAVTLAVRDFTPPELPYYPSATSIAITVYATPDYDALTGTYLIYLPDLEEGAIATNGVPTEVYRGVQHGFSLPTWNATNNEQLYFNIVVPSFWDGESDIVLYADVSIDTSNTDRNFRLVTDWEHWTPDADLVPSTNTTVIIDTPTASGPQYQSYQLQYTIDYDTNGAGNEVAPGDILSFRTRRLGALSDEAAGEIVVHRTTVAFRRGDLSDYVTDAILQETYVAEADVENLVVEVAEQVDLVAWFLQLAIVATLGGLAFWRRHFFLYILAGAAAMSWGIYYAGQGDQVYLALGITVVVAGLFMIYRSAMILLGR